MVVTISSRKGGCGKTVLAMILAKLWGFSHVFLLGLGLYVLVGLLALTGLAFGLAAVRRLPEADA